MIHVHTHFYEYAPTFLFFQVEFELIHYQGIHLHVFKVYQGCEKAPVTSDIVSYFSCFGGCDSLVKRQVKIHVGDKMALLHP